MKRRTAKPSAKNPLLFGPSVVRSKMLGQNSSGHALGERSMVNVANHMVALGIAKPFSLPLTKGSIRSFTPPMARSLQSFQHPRASVEKFTVQPRPKALPQYVGMIPTKSKTSRGPWKKNVFQSSPSKFPEDPKVIEPRIAANSLSNATSGSSISSFGSQTSTLSNGERDRVRLPYPKISSCSTSLGSRTSLLIDDEGGDRSRLPPILLTPVAAAKKVNVSPREKENSEKLRLELHRSRLDNEASERRISRLVRKIEELELSKSEAKGIQTELEDMDKRLHSAIVENKQLKRKLGIEGPSSPRGDGLEKQEKDAFVGRIKELTSKSDALSTKYTACMRQIKEYQSQMLDALAISDADLCQSVANGGIGESSKTCGPVKLHAFIRTSVEKLKSGHNAMLRELSHLRCENHQEVCKTEGLTKHVETLQGEKKRMLETFQDHESQIEYLSSEIKLLREVLNDETKKDAEAEINSLLEANEALSQDLTRQRAEWTIKVSNLERDVEHERSRYDALESLAAEERDETEKRWQQLWEAHSERIKDEVNTLKLNYTNPLKQSQEREEKLKKDLSDLSDRYNERKRSWDEYRLALFGQMEEWKKQYIKKCELLSDLREEKAGFDAKFMEKQKELEELQQIFKDGVEERLELQKKIEALQHKLREVVGIKEAVSEEEALNVNLGMLSTSRSWFSIGDFKKLKEKLTKSQSQLQSKDEDK